VKYRIFFDDASSILMVFSVRQHAMHAERDIVLPILSVRPSVRPSVCPMPVLCLNNGHTCIITPSHFF